MSPNQYYDKIKFNVTNMIEQNFIEKNELINTIINKMDFSQVTKLSFISNIPSIDEKTGQVTYSDLDKITIEQSLAVNCVENLPLPYYKDFITADWVNSEGYNSKNIINYALNAHKYDFIDYLLELATDKYHSMEDNHPEFYNYADDYSVKILNPLLNIGKIIEKLNSINSSQERYAESYNLFRKAVNFFPVHFKRFYQNRLDEPLVENNKNKINEGNWFIYYNELNSVYYELENKKSILKVVLAHENNFDIYFDIYNQLETTDKNILKNVTTLEQAIINGNTLVVQHLSQQLNFNNQQLSTLVENIIEKQIIKLTEDYNAWEGSIYDNEDYRNYISNIKLLFKVIDSLPGYKIKDFSTISSVVLLDSTYVEEFIKKHPEIQHQPIVQNCTIREWLQAEELFKDFIKEEGLTTNNEENPITYDLLLVSKLKDFVDPSSKEENNKTAIQNLIINNYLSKITSLTKQESCAIFNMNVLNKKIPNKEDKIKSKIKI